MSLAARVVPVFQKVVTMFDSRDAADYFLTRERAKIQGVRAKFIPLDTFEEAEYPLRKIAENSTPSWVEWWTILEPLARNLRGRPNGR